MEETNRTERAVLRPDQVSALTGDAKAFVRNPRTFARKLGIPIDALSCPPEAHDALKRAENLAKTIQKSGPDLSEEGISEVRRQVSESFGRDFEVSFVPFGLQFRERMRLDPRAGITATGTVSVTWADTDTDVDG